MACPGVVQELPSSCDCRSDLWRKGFKKRLPNIPPRVSIRIRSKSAREKEEINKCLCNSTWKIFPLAQVQAATNNFSSENLIGKGGSAEVYKGRLSGGQVVAIKRLNKGIPEEQVLSFLSEIGIMAHINHPNIAKMIGYGVEGGTHLVLQFSSLGSLRSRLHNSKDKLNWNRRYKIILGIAEGLCYLHENGQRRIIHRDIKVDNILLSEDFEPQICDFGLAKWLPRQWSHRSATKFEGTFGYFAPEYFMHGVIDEKTDVYAFGVLLLEIITGRQALDESRKSLVMWSKPLLESNAIAELVDPFLQNNYNRVEMGWVVSTAKMCIDEIPMLRPRMSQVVTMLGGNDKTARLLSSHHKKQFIRRTYSDELSYAEEYNSTKSLIQTNKHDQILDL
ncbi:receptor-like cytosolic serine/threonine-protein kinase RBK2 [Andrographis paniculata]|uniref:receptor-like cytosolic serine/threonine-protein kinase RBK2 n=1 Tax=Andrographis paniculata TaxID=175694 RepID=UPI0021E7B19B|nr:receptor-like cytosolic serine/threonine-protein kinase RBK2 [Andrographis paniculata]